MKRIKDFISQRVLSRTTVLLLDIIIMIFSVISTRLFLYEYEFTKSTVSTVLIFLIVLLFFNLITFFSFKTFSGILRFSSFFDLLKIIYALTIGYALTFITVTILNSVDNSFELSFQMVALSYIVNSVLMVFLRIITKETYDVITNYHDVYTNVFIYGTQQPGIRIAKSLKGANEFRFSIKGFISDENQMIGKNIFGVTVYAADKDVLRILEQYDVRKIIISPNQMEKIKDSGLIDEILESSVSLVTTLPFSEWSGNRMTKDQFKEVEIEDLLPRKQITINMSGIAKNLEGKRVMVTGAAGSIGQEIVRQVAAFNPYNLILIDQAETPLHSLRLEIKDKWKELKAKTVIADIANYRRLDAVFNEFKPEYIFHAAAYKHVPMMEDNVSEAINTNIRGTKYLADLAVKYNANKFVMISTDKAVNPTNVMGCSKRIAEIYIQSLANHIKDKKISPVQFITTRFGNVLGSNGSVIPRFREQIKKGGPVTVTHPEIIRYFMTISEACQLVLEAGSMGKGGEIYIFDMGEPVKILDLAKRMIRLSETAKNIKIEFTGLRHGEKLYEELLNVAEHTLPTYNEKIMVAKVREYEYEMVNKQIENLIEDASINDDMTSVALMKQIVPEFKSINSPFEQIDKENEEIKTFIV